MRNDHCHRPAALVIASRRAKLEAPPFCQFHHSLRLPKRLRSNGAHVATTGLEKNLRTFSSRIEGRNRRRSQGKAECIIANSHRRRLESKRVGVSHPPGEARLELRAKLGIDIEKCPSRTATQPLQ